MPKCGPIGLCGQNQALWAHVWAENGPKTAEMWAKRQKLFRRFLLSPVDDITLWLERPSIGVIIPVLPFTLLQV